MAASIPAFIAGFKAAFTGATVAASTAAAVGKIVGSIVISTAISATVSALSGRPSTSPQDVQANTRQAIPSRIKHYGRVKTGGAVVFKESKAGTLHLVIAFAHGESDAIEEYWIDDNLVEIDGSNLVTTAPYTGKVRLEAKLGTADQTVFSALNSAFTEITTAHRGRGVGLLYVQQLPVAQDKFLSTFPNADKTNYRVVLRATKVWNPITEVTAWDDNAAAVIRDFLISPDGFGIDEAMLTTPEAQASWEAAYAICDQDVDLNAGGSEKRYRLWVSYDLQNERRADVLNAMLRCCDARPIFTSDGGLGIEIGEWSEPSATMDGSAIIGFSGLSKGKGALSVANTITATYYNPDADYTSAEADPWVDAADVAARGEQKLQLSFPYSPSHTQTRRLMKLAYYRANPEYVGTFDYNYKGLALLGRRFARVQHAPFGINEVFEQQNLQMNYGENGIISSVTATVQSMPEAAYDWDKTTDEGSPPTVAESSGAATIEVPDNFNVTIQRISVAGQLAPQAVLTWDTPSVDSLEPEAQFKLDSATDWTELAISRGGDQATTGVLSDGDAYDFRVRFRASGGTAGAWATEITLTPTADTTAPGVPTGVSGTGGVGVATIDWTAPNSANYSRSKVYRHTSNSFGAATLIETVYSSPSAVLTYDDTIAAGTYYYWVTAENVSGVASTAVATGAVTVT